MVTACRAHQGVLRRSTRSCLSRGRRMRWNGRRLRHFSGNWRSSLLSLAVNTRMHPSSDRHDLSWQDVSLRFRCTSGGRHCNTAFNVGSSSHLVADYELCFRCRMFVPCEHCVSWRHLVAVAAAAMTSSERRSLVLRVKLVLKQEVRLLVAVESVRINQTC